MMIRVSILSAVIIALVPGCATRLETLGEKSSGYTYVPVDPFSVKMKLVGDLDKASLAGSNLLESLPDNAVRISVKKVDASGTVTYGPAGLSVKGSHYQTTVDYINADTTNIKLFIARSVLVRQHRVVGPWILLLPYRYEQLNEQRPDDRRVWIGLTEPLPWNAIAGSESYYVRRIPELLT